jgi:hypothetical protein
VLAGASGFDHGYGRRLEADLAAAGLEDVDGEGRASLWRGGGPGGRLCRLTFLQLREAMVAAGTPAQDVDRAIALCDRPRLAIVSPLAMAAWGRAPSA